MKVKILPIIMAVIIVTLIIVAGSIYSSYTQEKTHRISLQKKLDDVTKEKKALEAQLEISKKQIAEQTSKLTENDRQIKVLTVDLDSEKQAKQKTMAELEAAKSDLDTTKKDLDSAKQLKGDLEAKLSKSELDLKNLQSKLNELEGVRTKLETKIKDLEAATNEVKLDKIVVTNTEGDASSNTTEPAKPTEASQAKSKDSGKLEGKVLVVNKNYDFIVINMGQNNGVVAGDTFSIYQADKLLGTATVEEVRPTICVANLAKPEIKDQIKEGDKVVKTQK